MKFVPISEALFDKPPANINQNELVNQVLTTLKNRSNLDDIEIELLRALQRLAQKGRFKIKIYEAGSDDENEYTYGYFSAFENCIYLIANKKDFQTKWLGLAVDYDNFSNESFDHFISTALHELMHYTCSNAYESYNKIWRKTFRSFLWSVFDNICNNYFFDFVSKDVYDNVTNKAFISSPDFKRAFDAYYNSLSINMRFRSSSFIKRYNDLLSTLYSKHNFRYARFFDNILVNVHKLAIGEFTPTSLKIYQCIGEAYSAIEPSLKNVKINNLFYQEMYEFSEISCVLSTYYKNAPKHRNSIIETLKLI